MTDTEIRSQEIDGNVYISVADLRAHITEMIQSATERETQVILLIIAAMLDDVRLDHFDKRISNIKTTHKKHILNDNN